MVTRITRSGLQSIGTPLERKRKKKELEETPEPKPKPAPRKVDAGANIPTRGQTRADREAQAAKGLALGAEAQAVKGFKEQQAIEAAARELSPQVGVPGDIGQVEKDPLSREQAAKSALGLTAAGIAGGAATGAAAGLIGGPAAPVTVPVAAVVGGVVGGVSTFIGGFRSNLKTQRKDMLTGEAANIRKIESNMLKHIMNVDKGGDPYEWLELFNEQMALADESYERLQLETSDDLSKWLGEDGHTQLEKFETFNSPGGARDTLTNQMREAIFAPDPNRIYPLIDSATAE